MKKNNINKLILILLNSKNYITIKKLSTMMDVSIRSIGNYLVEIEPILIENDLKLIKKQGVGIKIVGTNERVNILKNKFIMLKSQFKINSNQDIFIHLFFILVIKNKKVFISNIADDIHISPPSLYKQLYSLEKWLNKRNIEIIRRRDKGIYVDADEKLIRDVIFEYILMVKNYIDDENLFSNNVNQDILNYINKFNLDNLLEFKKIVLEIEKIVDIQFTTSTLSKIVFLMAITKDRIYQGKVVKLDKNIIESMILEDIYGIKDKLFYLWNKKIYPKLSDDEAFYLLGIFFASRTMYNSNIEIDSSLSKLIVKDSSFDSTIKLIINKVYEYFEIENKENFEELIRRWLELIFFRISYARVIYNPSINIINHQFKNMISFLAYVSKIIYEKYNYALSDSELSLFAIHVATSIEASKKPLSGCFVYNGNYDNTKFTLYYLKNNVKQINVIDVMPSIHLEDIDSSKYDVIIFNYQNEKKFQIPQIIIPPVFSYEYFLGIIPSILKLYEEINQNKLFKNNGSDDFFIF